MFNRPKKSKFACEECCFDTDELFIVKEVFLFCKECAEAQKRRIRLEREQKEWDRVGDQKNVEKE